MSKALLDTSAMRSKVEPRRCRGSGKRPKGPKLTVSRAKCSKCGHEVAVREGLLVMHDASSGRTMLLLHRADGTTREV